MTERYKQQYKITEKILEKATITALIQFVLNWIKAIETGLQEDYPDSSSEFFSNPVDYYSAIEDIFEKARPEISETTLNIVLAKLNAPISESIKNSHHPDEYEGQILSLKSAFKFLHNQDIQELLQMIQSSTFPDDIKIERVYTIPSFEPQAS